MPDLSSKTAEAELTNPTSHDPATNIHKELHYMKL